MRFWKRVKRVLEASEPSTVMSTHNLWPLWRQFRIDETFARNYPLAYNLHGFGGTHRDIILDLLLPELLLIKASAILDAALVSNVAAMREPMPRKYRPTLGGRVRYLTAIGVLQNGEKLIEAINRRNDFAHVLRARTGTTTQIDAAQGWKRFDGDVRLIENALQKLGALPPAIPKFDYRCERSAMRDAPKGWERTFTVQVTQDGKPAAEVAWTETTHHAGEE